METGEVIEYPSGFVERMRVTLGDELPAFLRALGAPEVGLRVNILRLSPEAFEALKPFDMTRLAYPAEGFLVTPETRAGRHPYHAAGLYYLQDPGAMMVGALVGARAGERVLDLSAAPGGKATHLAARMANEGVLIANDVNRSRAVELGRNLERCGVTNAVVTCAPAHRLADQFGAYFDRVVVDAPCSGESMFHKSRAAREDWSPEVVRGCARRQHDLLQQAAALVRAGGRLVYSTCTFSREENEEVLETFLERRTDFEMAGLDSVSGAETVGLGGDAAAYRLWPHRVAGAGHFVAALRRIEEDGRHIPAGNDGDRPRGGALDGPSKQDFRLYQQFMEVTYPGREGRRDRLVIRGATLFELPENAPPFGRLDVVRPGLELGVARSGRFEPSHGLALAVAPEAARDGVTLSLEDPRVERYLQGHPIEASGASGWLPVTVEGFALGWGKSVGSVVKNHYPKGLRRMG